MQNQQIIILRAQSIFNQTVSPDTTVMRTKHLIGKVFHKKGAHAKNVLVQVFILFYACIINVTNQGSRMNVAKMHPE